MMRATLSLEFDVEPLFDWMEAATIAPPYGSVDFLGVISPGVLFDAILLFVLYPLNWLWDTFADEFLLLVFIESSAFGR